MRGKDDVVRGRGGCVVRRGGCVVRRGGCGVKVGWAWHEGRAGSNVVRCLCVLR